MRRIFVLLISILLTACGPGGPQPGAPASTEAVRAFYVGLAALQVGDDVRAKAELTKATELVPNEPAAWANLGILQMRHKDFDAAANSLERARSLADKDPVIYETIALLEKQRGNFDASQANLQKAIDLDPKSVKAMYALAKEKERQTDDTAARKLYDQILTTKTDNLEVRIDAMRLAAKQGDTESVKRTVAALEPTLGRFVDAATRTQFDSMRAAVNSGDARNAVVQITYFRNVLLREAQFRKSVDEVKYSDTNVGEPFTRPLSLQVPQSVPAPADTTLTFDRDSPAPSSRWSKVFYLNGDAAPIVVTALEGEIQIGKNSIPFSAETASGLTAIDFDYDFKNDVAISGSKGFRLFRQTDNGFADATPATKLPADVVDGSYAGVWVFDVESDGDLDLFLASTAGAPMVLQNNSDGTLTRLTTFDKVDKVRDFVAVDLDEDGDADAIVRDEAGDIHFFTNERGGSFIKGISGTDTLKNAAFTVGDADANGRLDAAILQTDGTVLKLADKDTSGLWEPIKLTSVDAANEPRSILLADLDNNGGADIIISGERETNVWLRVEENRYTKLSTLAGSVTSIADINGDGRLDLLGSSTFANRGAKSYNWQSVRPRAAKTTGDQRVNSFGIGGELELRSGLLLQKRLITEPVVHFGLGENGAADVLRVVWQNGFVQAEFDLKPNQPIAAEQRLKGSCPHLFAFNGEKFALVKDAPPWSPALGLKINAQDVFGVLETEEWFKVPGDALKPTKDNFYELRITGEYWESFYIDQYSLLVVDHPESTEVFTDERFSVPPPPLEVFTTGVRREFASAKDDKGKHVSVQVGSLDELYLDGFERGSFQGVAKDHFVEVELPSDAPLDKRIAIIADGWVHPTDASINVQLGQSSKEKPRSLSLEVRGPDGAWKVAKENLGFPAGKMKTMVIELPVGARAARLRTNMEIFWDKLAWSIYETGEQNKTTRLELAGSDLRYRGFSVIEKADDSSPEKPLYDRLLTTSQRWRDMEGYFTRFGDVSELLLQTDDRIVLMNAGDELVLKFAALPAPPAGYRRDFVLIGNGWIKDGDLNSVFSKTLIPLPTHGSNDYSRPPTTLENDPVYRKHKDDWVKFHTRYISPDRFRNALR